jgi:hypothetical protein
MIKIFIGIKDLCVYEISFKHLANRYLAIGGLYKVIAKYNEGSFYLIDVDNGSFWFPKKWFLDIKTRYNLR